MAHSMEPYLLRRSIFADLEPNIGVHLRPEQTVCPICLNPLAGHATLTHTVACKNSFHRQCIETWLIGAEEDRETGPCTCPVDRQPFECRNGDFWDLMPRVDWMILNRHYNNAVVNPGRVPWARTQPWPGMISMKDFMKDNYSIWYYGQNVKWIDMLNLNLSKPGYDQEEYLQIRLVEHLIRKFVPYTRQRMGSFTTAIFGNAPDWNFSVWDRWVAPRLDPEHRQVVELTFRDWAMFNDEKMLARFEDKRKIELFDEWYLSLSSGEASYEFIEFPPDYLGLGNAVADQVDAAQ
ncbi:hypothetical protein OHC33_005541 [Knufia fluminis]|uniref:RING-type domain-containing protein n=1 Tax=Knufia fluminis TaxID=191047 RepID=A0AAN8I445_9EURO|nr:hypothetical protein OHC33_005541 [Knufia fluminis]